MVQYFLNLLIFGLAISPGIGARQEPRQDVAEVLARSEALYYDANFKEALGLLIPLDRSLQSEKGRAQDKGRVKLQLALVYVALEDVGQAKTTFGEMCSLETECVIDKQNYPPKVVALFEEAKAASADKRCTVICEPLNKRIEAGDIAAVIEQLPSVEREGCGCLAEVRRDAADESYQMGLESYKKDALPDALQHFTNALKLNPAHAMASQYAVLTRDKLMVVVGQKVLDWRKAFGAGSLSAARDNYEQLLTLNIDGTADNELNQIRTEYRKALAPSIEQWSGACQSGDAVRMNTLRSQAVAMLPDPAMGKDLLDQMTTCTSKACVRMDTQKAMMRLKSSQKPVLPPEVQKALRKVVEVQVNTRIEENGDVTVLAVRGENTAINDAVKVAVGKWKFIPTTPQSESRCIETVFPFAITPSSP
jgi:tetratricopeptide (TPR) repeat protein